MERYHEPTPVEIKEQRLYLELGLTESEYERAVELLGRLPNYTETGMFVPCSGTAATRTRSRC